MAKSNGREEFEKTLGANSQFTLTIAIRRALSKEPKLFAFTKPHNLEKLHKLTHEYHNGGVYAPMKEAKKFESQVLFALFGFFNMDKYQKDQEIESLSDREAAIHLSYFVEDGGDISKYYSKMNV